MNFYCLLFGEINIKQYRLILLCILTQYFCTADIISDPEQNMLVQIPNREAINRGGINADGLRGAEGEDTSYGGDGNASLREGSGTDRLHRESTDNTYIYTRKWNHAYLL